ncbi:MAG: tetratricopeptide (TPR) repeat protein [Planctomycetota bacterium]|jgi:tetratricopeptide (TPR) repeat protein
MGVMIFAQLDRNGLVRVALVASTMFWLTAGHASGACRAGSAAETRALSPQSAPPETPETPAQLWQRGERHAAIEAWKVQLATGVGHATDRLELAQCQMQVHQYRDACSTLASLLNGQLAQADEIPARARSLAGRARVALCEYGPALELLVESGEEGRMRVHCLLRLNRSQEADEALARLLAGAKPAPRDLHKLEASRLSRIGNHALAADHYERLYAEDPFDPEVLFGLAQALIRTKRRERGLTLLQRHRELTPLFDQLDFAQRGVDLSPIHAPNHARVGELERQIGRVKRAKHAYETALTLAQPSELTSIALRLARLQHEDLDRTVDALSTLESAAKRQPDVRLHVRRGDLYCAIGRYEDAASAYRSGLELRPTDRAIQERLTRAAKQAQDSSADDGSR